MPLWGIFTALAMGNHMKKHGSGGEADTVLDG